MTDSMNELRKFGRLSVQKWAKKGDEKEERTILSEIRKWLDAQSFFWKRIEGGAKKIAHGKAKSEMSGMPDIIIIKGGVVFGVEIKRPYSGIVSESQSKILSSINENGGIAGIVTSVEGLKIMLEKQAGSRSVQTPHGPLSIWD